MSEQSALAAVGHFSDSGYARRDEPNQDSYRLPLDVSAAQLQRKGWLFVVADGRGPQTGDERGSQMAVNLIHQTYYADPTADVVQSLKRAFAVANAKVFDKSHVLFNEFSASVVCVVVLGNTVTIAHAGHSRAYLISPQRIQSLTTDHVVSTEPDETESVAAKKTTPQKLLTRSVGSTPTIDADTDTFTLQADERILLCTQGLSSVVTADELQAMVSHQAPADAVRQLVDLANQRGGPENVTAVVVDPSALAVAAVPAPPEQKSRRAPWLVVTGIIGIIGLTIVLLARVFIPNGPTARVSANLDTAIPTQSLSQSATSSPSPTIRAAATATHTPYPTATHTPAPATDTPRPTPTHTPPPPLGNFAGTWYHNFGSMSLNQSGSLISGTYSNGFAGAQGKITGNVIGDTLNGTWTINGESGSLQWTLDPDANTFDGNYSGTGKWCGARSGNAFRAGCAFAGQWIVDLAENGVGSMYLVQINNTVSGTYLDGRALEGIISYVSGDAVVVLMGTWRVSAEDTGDFAFYLLGEDSLRFQGNWGQGNRNKGHPWCGWRRGYDAPSPCLR